MPIAFRLFERLEKLDKHAIYLGWGEGLMEVIERLFHGLCLTSLLQLFALDHAFLN